MTRLAPFLLVVLIACGCAPCRERFSLSARLVRPKTNGSVRLAIELRNVSSQPQRIATLTNLFEGHVCLRDAAGDVHEFTQTNYLNMLVTTLWMTPTVELAPGGSYRWEHPLAEFIDSYRLRTEHSGNSYSIAFPVLSAEFQPGCEIWCAFDVRQKKMLDERRSTHETTATVVSATIRHSK